MSTPEERDRAAARAAAERNDSTEVKAAVPAEAQKSHREDVIEREKERFGGMKFGSAFFGWLSATGLTVILSAIIGAIVVGFTGGIDDAADETLNAQFGDVLVSAIILLVVLFVSYYCGGYVAGRMARFAGAKQGIAVWLWAVIVAIILFIVGLIAGSQFSEIAGINAFPQIPTATEDLSVSGIVTALLAFVVTLVGAILGGLAGMRFHRRVDRAGLGR